MNRRSRLKHAVSAVLGWSFLLLGAGCSEPLSVEQQIIVTIRDMEARIEAGERRNFMEHIATEFEGQHQSLSRDQLNALILYQFNRHKNLQAQLFPIHVTALTPDRAEAWFNALLTGGSGMLPEAGQMYEIKTRWHLRDGEWMLVGADWEPTDLDLLPE